MCGRSVAHAQQTDNLRLSAVPATQPVTVDGDLSEWDLSGRITSSPHVRQFAESALARTAVMYDTQGVYFAFQIEDPSPLANQVDPEEPGQIDQGWRSDAVTLRLFTDEEIHITTWYYAPRRMPWVYLHFGKPLDPNRRPEIANALAHGAKTAFRTTPTGSIQELFLPWQLLSTSGNAYTAENSVGLGIDFTWGHGDNRSEPIMIWQDVVASAQVNRKQFWTNPQLWGRLVFSPAGNLALPPQPWDRAPDDEFKTTGHVPIEYQLPADGFVTLVIETESGRRVRNLIGNFPRQAGANVDHWDGLNDDGQPVKPGNYRWRGLWHPGIGVEYVTHLFPATNPPWRNATGTGGWAGDHTPPADVVCSADRVFLLYPIAEMAPALIALDLEGNNLWEHAGALQGGGDVMTLDGEHLYYAYDSKKPDNYNPQIWKVSAATGRTQRFATGLDTLPTGFDEKDMQATGIAVRGDDLFLACANRNLVRQFNLKTDRRVRDFKIPSPQGMAFDSSGRLLIASADDLLELEPKTGKTKTLVRNVVPDPRGLRVGPDDSIYVVSWKNNQILRFTREGRPLGHWGRPGGRAPTGPWDPQGLLKPQGVGIDGQGNVWICENDGVTKRLSKWTSAGQFASEWFGSTPYGGDGNVDANRPDRILIGGFEFVFEPGQPGPPRPHYVHLRGSEAGQPASAGLVGSGSFEHRQGRVLNYKNHEYFVFDRGLICIRRGDAWAPAAAIGAIKTPVDKLLWSDLNEDGNVQEKEIVDPAGTAGGNFLPWGGGGWGVPFLSPDLSTVRSLEHGPKHVRIKPVRFTRGGVPVYNAKSLRVFELPYTDGNGGAVEVDDNILIDPYEDSHAPWVQVLKNHRLGNLMGLKAFNRDGKLLWTYPQPFSGVEGGFRAPLPARPDDFYGALYVMGAADLGRSIGRVICFNGYWGNRFLMTTDGLFIASILKDTRQMPHTPEKAIPGMSLDDMTAGVEAFAGTFGQWQDGRVYLTGNLATTANAILAQVNGLERIQRLSGGTIDLKKITSTRDANAATAQAAAATLRIVQGTRALDGNLVDWDANAFVPIRGDAKRQARAALAYDRQFLYAAFEVTDNTPWKNAATEAPAMFLHGDSVDLRLGLDSAADPKRTEPVAGDTRIAIAPVAGQPTVVLYQSRVPGFTGERTPFTSPVRTVEFDRVQTLTQAQVTVKVDPGRGYRLEAMIPLSDLNFAWPAGRTIVGDLGVLFSDEAGVDCVLRRYWSDQTATITADLPSEARLDPSQWGSVRVE